MESSSSVLGQDWSTLAKEYPAPRGTVNNYYKIVSNHLKGRCFLHCSYQRNERGYWSCSYDVTWPSKNTFTGMGHSKASAANQAALKALHWLKEQGLLEADGQPVLEHDSQEPGLPVLQLTDIQCERVERLLRFYDTNVQPLFAEENAQQQSIADGEDEMEILQSITGNKGFGRLSIGFSKLERRNEELYQRYVKRKNRSCTGSSMPIAEYREQICELVANNPVVVIQGQPGCGKSTQVVQFLLDYWASKHRGADCNVVITQPRRISAITLAEWVAQERGESVGDVVGYQVRLNSAVPRSPGSIIFCSTGILLQRLQSDPTMTGASHVIIDEAHERDINTDFLLKLLRRALKENPELRVVIMSATIRAELFQAYFGGAPALHVPGFSHEVKAHFLDNMKMRGVDAVTLEPTPQPEMDANLVGHVVRWVHETRPPGAVLCFLPGWSEIKAVGKILSGLLDPATSMVLPLHSRLSAAEQRRIFRPPPPGVRKVILATNIAETSITINDVVYVVDTGAHKEQRLDPATGVSCLDSQWISHANVRQRRGRAGRVQPGEAYHLFSTKQYEAMDPFPVPEMLRVPLTKTVLDAKAFSRQESPRDFLSEMPEPPSSQAVEQAVEELYLLGALDDSESLTALGTRIAFFSTHPKLSKALVHSAVFKCVSPVLTVATLLSNDIQLFSQSLEMKEQIRKVKSLYEPSSDHLAVAKLYQQWDDYSKRGSSLAYDVCDRNGIDSVSLENARKLRNLVLELVRQSGMLEDTAAAHDPHSTSNAYAENGELVKGVLLSGFHSLAQWSEKAKTKKKKKSRQRYALVTDHGRHAILTSESVNFHQKNLPTKFVTYFREVQAARSRLVTLRETSLLTPLAAFLFCGGDFKLKPVLSKKNLNDHVTLSLIGSRTIEMICERRTAELLLSLRLSMWHTVGYLVESEGLADRSDDVYRAMKSYQSLLLRVVATLLTEAQSEDQMRDKATTPSS